MNNILALEKMGYKAQQPKWTVY